MSTRVGIYVTHPIQYFAPQWRALAQSEGLDVTVQFVTDFGVSGARDPDFQRDIQWDVPLLTGYDHAFMHRSLDIRDTRAFRLSRPARDAIRQFDRVVIHGYTHPFEREVIRHARRHDIPVIQRGEFTDHSWRRRTWFKARARNAYLRWFYSHIAQFCYIGRHAKLHLLRFGIPESRLHFSPYSVDTTLFEHAYASHDPESARSRLGLRANDFVFLFSGKMIERKAPEIVLDAFGAVQKDFAHACLVMLGSGPMLAELRERALTLGLNALFPGFVNQQGLGEYYRSADAFVLASRYETWGLVANEAMQFGLPVIATDMCGCASDLILPDETGLICKAGDSTSLREMMASLIAKPEHTTRMGQAARRQVSMYSTQASVNGLIHALNRAA